MAKPVTYQATKDKEAPKESKTTGEKLVLEDFRRARAKKREWIEAATKDYEFAVGDQWKDSDVSELESVGVKALTINKIQPNLFLISGIERQNRTDFKAFPEGEEDSVTADIATGLLKNAMKRTLGEYKLSEIFEDGVICGEGWLEPFIDYTYDLINGDLKLKKINPFTVFVDPDSTEYDLSDAEFVIKFTAGLTKKAIIRLFPNKKKQVEAISTGGITLDQLGDGSDNGIEPQTKGYRDNAAERPTQGEIVEAEYDLTEYYYRNYVTKYLVADKTQGTLKEVNSKEEAENYVKQATVADQEGAATAVVIERTIPEIWVRCLVGQTEIDDYKCSFFPMWKSYPLIPFFAHRITTPIKKKHLMVQGIVRSLIDPQLELNKRRTQELRHLNSSTNSGWLSPKGAWVKKADVKKFGSSAGAILEYNQGKDKPERIYPMALSAGHHELSAQAGQDIKEISGINADLLALQEGGQSSGRAIHLRQQQGVVMLQRILDNYGQTKQLLGRFILSQLGQLYSVDTATKVMGQAFITENFSIPVHELAQKAMARKQAYPNAPISPEEQKAIAQTQAFNAEVQNAHKMVNEAAGQPGAPQQGISPVVDEMGELVMVVDQEAVGQVFNMVLTDTEVGKYDIAVGEAANSQTVKFANYLMLTEMAKSGMPIPPDVIVEESGLQLSSKKKILNSIAAAQKAAAAQPAKAPRK